MIYCSHTGIKNDPVLIVEDTKYNQILLQSFCNEINVECDVADNGKEALDKISENKYSVFIVDLMMPIMDGRAFIEHLKLQIPDALVMVQTGIDSSQTIIDLLKLGIFDYIVKPIEKDQFIFAMKRALEHRRLKDLESKQVIRFQSELINVRQIQASLLPNFNQLTGFDAAFSILPVDDLSGDFLDGYMVDEKTYQIVLCDVSGHGISSAYIGIEIRSIFRTLSAVKQSPSSLIDQVNLQLINNTSNTYFFATVLVCQIDLVTGFITYGSGGHLPSYLYKSSDGRCSEVNANGALIGIIKNKKYSDTVISMEKDDCLLMYTDGITESLHQDKKTMYDEIRLQDTFLDSVKSSSVDIIHTILDSVFTFTNHSEQQDDLTILCLKKD